MIVKILQTVFVAKVQGVNIELANSMFWHGMEKNDDESSLIEV